jgi:large subunit ribosomal protein L33
MAGKKKDIRPVVYMTCGDCKERNYTTEKNRRNDPGRIEMKKYCPRCRKHTLHKESK